MLRPVWINCWPPLLYLFVKLTLIHPSSVCPCLFLLRKRSRNRADVPAVSRRQAGDSAAAWQQWLMITPTDVKVGWTTAPLYVFVCVRVCVDFLIWESWCESFLNVIKSLSHYSPTVVHFLGRTAPQRKQLVSVCLRVLLLTPLVSTDGHPCHKTPHLCFYTQL